MKRVATFFIGDVRRETRHRDLIGALLLASVGVVDIAFDGVSWWPIVLLAVGAICALVFAEQLLHAGRKPS